MCTNSIHCPGQESDQAAPNYCPALQFPSALEPYQRAVLHGLAERHGIVHQSTGEGSDHHIVLGNPAGDIQVIAELDHG